MTTDILFLTPPLMQLNCPYPASMALAGYLQNKEFSVRQFDLSIELVNSIFTQKNISEIFERSMELRLKKQFRQMQVSQKQYITNIEGVLVFLKTPTKTGAIPICNDDFLPIGHRRMQIIDFENRVSKITLIEKAIWFATLFIEELADLIKEVDNPHFELIRYGEKLAVSLPEFQPLIDEVNLASGLVVDQMLQLLNEQIIETNPTVIAFTVPFPGNLLAALTCCKFIKHNFPTIKIAMGGGYVNTELRYLSDIRLFDYIDYLIFDDGEMPLTNLLSNIIYNKDELLIRTWQKIDNEIVKWNFDSKINHSFNENTIPSYTDIQPKNYISLIETANPMHSLWSCGFWNKLTLAHGCYWAKCAFCDTNLDYISRYEPNSAVNIVNQMEAVMGQTKQNGFHFTDEAIAPALIRKVCEEIVKRKLTVRWWGNIRFEQNFTDELCELMKRAGCIAVSGGLEMVSTRLLQLINKGVSVESATVVLRNFRTHGIMVHCYLMYGFPTQTAQETVDALEIVRQLFKENLIQSGFWHRFAMTLYSDSGCNPIKYGVKKVDISKNSFANNELHFENPFDLQNDKLGEGLNKALYNFLYKNGFELPINQWFDFSVPKTTVRKTFVQELILNN